MPWKPLDLDEIYSFVKNQESPVHENSLLTHFFPNFQTKGIELDLFRTHFNLYHYLYRLRERLQKQNREYLHIRLSKCFLFDIPKESCRHFSDESLTFCNDPLTQSSLFCPAHHHLQEKQKKNGIPGFQGMESYYLDKSNYQNMDTEQLEQIKSGVSWMFSSSEEIAQSLKLMNLSETCSLKRLKERYRYLALKNHPDRSGTESSFKKIHKAYIILKNWKENS